jgi:exo-1,4-beta-D-glucosaminidase
VNERLAWHRSTWFFTPTKTYADFTALSTLPEVRPKAVVCGSTSADGVGDIRVTVTNDSGGIAFFVRVRLSAGANDTDITPVTWSDGYVTLMPGEQQTLTARYRTADLHGEPPSVELSGWNVPRSSPAVATCG